MRRLYRFFLSGVYRRWALWYIGSERRCTVEGLALTIPPGVFHPLIHFSTPIFLTFLKKANLQGKKVLDMGTGSGLIALFAAQNGGSVLATDINPLAVETARANAHRNGLTVDFQVSDLFDQVPPTVFDFVLANPPYYPKNPENAPQRAYFAGENHEYFDKFYRRLPAFMHEKTRIWMILSEDCDLDAISKCGSVYGFETEVVWSKKKWGEQFLVLESRKR